MAPTKLKQSKSPKIGVLLSRIRVEEKMLLSNLDRRGIEYDRIEDGTMQMDIANPGQWLTYDAVLERSLSYTRGLYATSVLNAWGVPTVNMASVAQVCGDKLATTNALSPGRCPAAECENCFYA